MKNKKDCDCIQKMTDLIKEKVTGDKIRPKGFKIIEADWEYKSWYPFVRLYSNFITTSTFEKKDGTTSRPQKSHVSVFYSYCPFCGKKYDETKLK